MERKRAEIARQFFGQDPETGIALLESLLPVIREWMTGEFDDEAWCLAKLGYITSHTLDSRTSETYFRAALKKYETARGKECLEYAQCLMALAIMLGDHGNNREAAVYARESRDILRRLYGEDHVQTVSAEMTLARFSFNMGDIQPDWLEQRIELERRYLQAFKKQYGDSKETGMAFHERAAEDMFLGRYDEAELYYEEALKLLRRSLGTDHTIVASCIRNWGLLKCWQGDYEASEELFQEAIRIRREVLGEFTGKLGYDLSRYAELKYRTGELEAAEDLLRESIRILDRVAGHEHPRVTALTIKLGRVLLEQGRLDDAEAVFAAAYGILMRSENKLAWGEWGKGMAALCIAREEYERADSLCNEVLTFVERYYDETHPDISQILLWMGRNHIKRGEPAAALPLLERAARGYEVSRRRASVQNLNRISYAVFASPYPSLAAVRVRLNQELAAWDAAERDRGRALLDMVSTRWGRELTGEELAEEQRLDNEIVRVSGILDVLAEENESSVPV
ncbi:MAG: tetratricopeptide repeat-containing protein, partial [bacterium]